MHAHMEPDPTPSTSPHRTPPHPNPPHSMLQVLNVGGNQVSGKLKIQGMPKLRALIANDNAITAVKGAVPSGDLTTRRMQ